MLLTEHWLQLANNDRKSITSANDQNGFQKNSLIIFGLKQFEQQFDA